MHVFIAINERVAIGLLLSDPLIWVLVMLVELAVNDWWVMTGVLLVCPDPDYILVRPLLICLINPR